MRIKKSAAVGLLALAVSFPLAACGDDDAGMNESGQGEMTDDMMDDGMTDGDMTDGDLTDGDMADGDMADGDMTDGDMADGDLTDGDMADGEMTDGGMTDGGDMGGMMAGGSFAGAEGHAVSGEVTVDGDTLMLTGFSSDEGPDLHLYLTNGADEVAVSDGVNLGEVAYDQAEQSFMLNGMDPADYTHVVVHCDEASEVFGAAKIG